MQFPYWDVHREGRSRLAPLVPLRIHGPEGSVDVVALVDSGAEQNVFGTDLAERLKIPLEPGTPVTAVGIGEHHHPRRLVSVNLQLQTSRWTAPVIFSAAAQERAILGQAGFFAFFTVTFRHAGRTTEVRRSRIG